MKHRFHLVTTLLAAAVIGVFFGENIAHAEGAVSGIFAGAAAFTVSANCMLIPWGASGFSQRLADRLGFTYDETSTNYAHGIAFDDDEAFRYVETRRALGQVDGVGFVPKPPFAEINFLVWSEDIKMTGSQCVQRIDVTTGEITA